MTLDADTIDALGFGEQWDRWDHAIVEALKRHSDAERKRCVYQPRTRKPRPVLVSAAESRRRWREKHLDKGKEAERKRAYRARLKAQRNAA